jgi:hypothetical protein
MFKILLAKFTIGLSPAGQRESICLKTQYTAESYL